MSGLGTVLLLALEEWGGYRCFEPCSSSVRICRVSFAAALASSSASRHCQGTAAPPQPAHLPVRGPLLGRPQLSLRYLGLRSICSSRRFTSSSFRCSHLLPLLGLPSLVGVCEDEA